MYKHVGACGIQVCERWRTSFVNFLEDIGKRPSKAYVFVRIDRLKDFEPDNVQWMAKKEQQLSNDSKEQKSDAKELKEQQDKINEIGNRDGCHTCGTNDPGTKSGNWIGDHQDPTKLNPECKPQRYYPQCKRCSDVQGGRLRWLKKP